MKRAGLLCVVATFALLAALALTRGLANRVTTARAADGGLAPTAGDFYAPELGLPATGLVAFGSSPGANDEIWGYGLLGATPVSVAGQSYSDQYALVEHDAASPDWHVVPLPTASDGKPLARSGEPGPATWGALAGQATAVGGAVLLSGRGVAILNPGGEPTLVPQPKEIESSGSGSGAGSGEEKGVLDAGESLLPPGGSRTIPYAVVEEEDGGHTGLLIAPFEDGGPSRSEPGVLHYDGREWTREAIEVPVPEQRLTPEAIACGGSTGQTQGSSPEDCWLLASYEVAGATRLGLFRRRPGTEGTASTWRQQGVSDWLLGEGSAPVAGATASVVALPGGAQMLTATAQGVWVDFAAHFDGEAAATDVSELVLNPEEPGAGSGSAAVAGTWCYPVQEQLCARSLGGWLPQRYRSFAWPGSSPSDPGTRVVTGLASRAMLELSSGSFSYEVGAGGETGLAPGGAALYRQSAGAPVEGWIADGVFKEDDGADGEGQSQAIELSPRPESDQLHEESVPFRHPLLALAQAPGSSPGDPGAEAVAVGLSGQIGRYAPGQGWRAEALYNSANEAVNATLRGVAWPESGRIYAVGDNGQMWLWRAETGLWEPDPAKPFNFIGNLTGIAFDPADSQLGYAVGKQGVLLRYGKSWEQVPLPAELQEANFTSIAFAGGEALATYRTLLSEPDGLQIEVGGVAVEEVGDGLHWHVDQSASELLAQLPSPRGTVLSKVAGLPDGGAVAAGPDLVIEREGPGAPWHVSTDPLPEAQSVSALAAYREAGGPVRAIASIELDRALDPGELDGNLQNGSFSGDVPPATGAGQPGAFIPPDPLPDSGYLVKETADGWVDMEHGALPVEQGGRDLPVRPDPVLAVIASQSGEEGLAVGGQTYDAGGHGPEEAVETAAASRFPMAASSAEGTTPAPVSAPSGDVSFVVAGDAACSGACSALANDGLGPDVWLEHARHLAESVNGVQAFLYTGGRLPDNATSSVGVGGEGLDPEAFDRELERFSSLLGDGSLPSYVAPSADVEPPAIGSEPFEANFKPSGVASATEGSGYSTMVAGVKLIVLDFSRGELGSKQLGWLRNELPDNGSGGQLGPATIVMGSDSLTFKLPQSPESGEMKVEQAKDGKAVLKVLEEGGASAYLFDYPSANVLVPGKVPQYGTGTLGYVEGLGPYARDSLGSSAVLLLSVNPDSREATAEAVPNIGLLALDATGGTLLARSHQTLFEGLARRSAAGVHAGAASGSGNRQVLPSAYDPIPFECQGPNCGYQVPIQYGFTSSESDIGGFVMHEKASANPLQVELNAKREPISDEPEIRAGKLVEVSGEDVLNVKGERIPRGEVDRSGLFCAYNSGTTTVSIAAGGLSYSEPVTVRGGAVEYPCGTVPLKNPPPRTEAASSPLSVPSAPPAPAPANPQPLLLSPPVPAVPPTIPAPARPVPHPQPPAVPHLAAVTYPVLALVPPPAPTVARPTPPSGTAPVSVPTTITQHEEEEEGAIEEVHNMAVYEQPDRGPSPIWTLCLIPIALAAGIGLRPRSRRDRRGSQTPCLVEARDTRSSGRRADWHPE